MTGAGAGDGDDAGSGSGSMKSVEEYKAKPPTAKELRELVCIKQNPSSLFRRSNGSGILSRKTCNQRQT